MIYLENWMSVVEKFCRSDRLLSSVFRTLKDRINPPPLACIKSERIRDRYFLFSFQFTEWQPMSLALVLIGSVWFHAYPVHKQVNR